MTNREMLEIAMQQSAEDIGCRTEDLKTDKNVLVPLKRPQIPEGTDHLQPRFLWKQPRSGFRPRNMGHRVRVYRKI